MNDKKGQMSGIGITNKRFAPKLNRILKQKNISKEEFAKRLDVPLPYILEVSKGRRSIQLDTLIRFCKVLNVPILDFTNCVKSPPAKEKELYER